MRAMKEIYLTLCAAEERLVNDGRNPLDPVVRSVRRKACSTLRRLNVREIEEIENCEMLYSIDRSMLANAY